MIRKFRWQPLALLFFLLFVGTFFVREKTGIKEEIAESVVDKSRIVKISVPCLGFDGQIREHTLCVLDIVKEEVVKIFQELLSVGFPMYIVSGYASRKTKSADLPSLHAYGGAIDINFLMNPYFDAVKLKFIPHRFESREKDKSSIVEGLRSVHCPESEIKEVLNVVTQPEGSDDRFLNRGRIRKGMVTSEIVHIFKKYGFSIWGGDWRQPIDFMHFQIPRELAEKLAANSAEEAKKIWKTHVESCR